MWQNLQQFLAGEIDVDGMASTTAAEMKAAAEQLLSEHPDWA
jgi:hypothetical protein